MNHGRRSRIELKGIVDESRNTCLGQAADILSYIRVLVISNTVTSVHEDQYCYQAFGLMSVRSGNMARHQSSTGDNRAEAWILLL
jgi:hypothetical protein